MMRTVTIVAWLTYAAPALAQDVHPSYIEDHVGPAAQQMYAEGLWHVDHIPRALEIAQAWGVGEASGISAEDARTVLRQHREDRARKGRLGAGPLHERLFLVGAQRTGHEMSCGERKQKQEKASLLRDRLWSLAQVWGVSTGIVGGMISARTQWTPIPGGIWQPKTPQFFQFMAPLGFGTMLLSMMANYSGQVATMYQYAPCTAGGDVPCVPTPPSLTTRVSRLRSSGSLPSALRITPMRFRPMRWTGREPSSTS